MKITQIFIITFLLFTASACDSPNQSMPEESKIKETVNDMEMTAKTSATLDKSDEMAKISYAIGANSGVFLVRNLSDFETWEMNIDLELIKAGFLDSLEKKSQMNEQEIQTVLMALQETIKTKVDEIDKQQAAVTAESNKLFLDTNAAKEGVMKTASGIQYRILAAGDGKIPVATDTVKVNYKGTLISGEEFDSSYKRGEPAQFPLNGVIPGWIEGLQLIKVGGKIELVLPPELAYGPRKTPAIPANSVLIFEVELLEIIQPEVEKTESK